MAIDLAPDNLPHALRGLASNPSVGTGVLEALARSDDSQVQHRLADRPGLPDALVAAFAQHQQAELRITLACNFDAALRVWRTLAADPHPGVRAALAGGKGGTMTDVGRIIGRERDPALPDEIGLVLAASPEPEVRLALAHRDNVTLAVVNALDADARPEIRFPLVPKVKDAPADLVRRWLADPATRRFAAVYHEPPADLVPALLADPDPEIRTAVALKAHLDVAAATGCARSPDPEIRRAIAWNHKAPLAAVLPLADDPDPRVRVALMNRADLPEEVLRHVAETIEPDNVPRAVRWLLPEYASLETRIAHAGSPLPFVRRSVAHSRDLPPAVVARLLADEDQSVRITMAIHYPDTPPDVLADLARSAGLRRDRQRLLEHPNFPEQVLVEAFANASTWLDPEEAASHPRIPPQAAARLAHDGSQQVRGYLAGNPALPGDVLVTLIGDESPYVVEPAARNPALPGWAGEALVEAGRRAGLLPE